MKKFENENENEPNVELETPSARAFKIVQERIKKIVTTEKWNSITDEAHGKSFTVANIMNADIIQEIYNHIKKARAEGKLFRDFKKEVINGGLMKRMQEAGWTGKGAHRLRVIYDTNIKTSAAKGRFDAFKTIADVKPYWIYKQVDRHTKRKDHEALNNKKFRHDDPIWNSIYPPSAFLCACYVVATANERGLDSGASYIGGIQESKEFQFNPLAAHVPDTTKYTAPIRLELDKMFKANELNKIISGQ